MRALAAGERPVTLIRPVLSRRWEVARRKAGKLFHLRENLADERKKHVCLILSSGGGKGCERLLTPQKRARQAGGAAGTVEAEFGAGKGANVKAGCAQAIVGTGVFLKGDQALAA